MKNGLIVDDYGNKKYYKDNLLHREDGPAIEYSDGVKEWYQNGFNHPLDGPAIEYFSGDKNGIIKVNILNLKLKKNLKNN